MYWECKCVRGTININQGQVGNYQRAIWTKGTNSKQQQASKNIYRCGFLTMRQVMASFLLMIARLREDVIDKIGWVIKPHVSTYFSNGQSLWKFVFDKTPHFLFPSTWNRSLVLKRKITVCIIMRRPSCCLYQYLIKPPLNYTSNHGLSIGANKLQETSYFLSPK